MAWITIFKAGKHKDASGKTTEWTEDDVKDMANMYNNQKEDEKHDAPIVIGHPKTDDPAQGWVNKLKYTGGKLLAETKQVSKTFAKKVKDGEYKKVSVRLYPNNLLRHVGYLGAATPAIKGLGDAMLSEFIFSEEEVDTNIFDEEEKLFKEDTAANKQEARSKKYGIQIQGDVKTPTNAVGKPVHYKDLSDDDFADPIHYKFPVHDKANTIVSLKLFYNYQTREKYSDDDRQIIGARLVEASLKHKLDKELIRNTYSEYEFPLTNTGEFKLTDEQKAFRDALIAAVESETSADVATKVSKIFAEKWSEHIKETPAKKPPAKKDVPPKKEETKEFVELKNMLASNQNEVESLKSELRDKQYNEYLSQFGHLSPAQKGMCKQILEMANKNTEQLEFAEGDKTVKILGTDLVKKFIESIPIVQKFGEAVTPAYGNADADDFEAQDKYIKEYNESLN